jgi:hypothetical protein
MFTQEPSYPHALTAAVAAALLAVLLILAWALHGFQVFW